MQNALIALAYVVLVAGVVACFVYLRRTAPGRTAGGTNEARPGPETERPSGSDSEAGAPGLADVTFQGPDFNSQSYGRLDARQTLELFQNLPWAEDFETFEEREASGGEGCPPNLSVVLGHGKRLLQVVCTGEGSFWVNVDPRSGRHEIDGLDASDIEAVLESHFAASG